MSNNPQIKRFGYYVVGYHHIHPHNAQSGKIYQ